MIKETRVARPKDLISQISFIPGVQERIYERLKRLSTLPAFINTTEKCAEGCPGEMRPLSAGCGETPLPLSGCRAVQGAVLSQPVILPEQLSRTRRKLEYCSYSLLTSSLGKGDESEENTHTRKILVRQPQNQRDTKVI